MSMPTVPVLSLNDSPENSTMTVKGQVRTGPEFQWQVTQALV